MGKRCPALVAHSTDRAHPPPAAPPGGYALITGPDYGLEILDTGSGDRRVGESAAQLSYFGIGRKP